MTKTAPSGNDAPMDPMSLEGDDALRLYYVALAGNLKAIDDQFADLHKALAEWMKISGAIDDAGNAS